MRNNRLVPFGALVMAGLLWGTTVPLTKVALAWLDPGWLTVARFTLAALPLAGVARRRLQAAMSPAVLASGAFGYGAVIVLQNAGIARTSVSHAALLVGATPVLVALMTVGLGRSQVRPLSWMGFTAALAGVGLIAGHGGDGATPLGDGLVFASLLASAAFVVAQPGILRGRDPVAVTAVQLSAGAVAALPVAGALEGLPAAPQGTAALGALAGLAAAGTLLPFTLFAYAQTRIAPEIAGAFLNLEPLVGAVVGVLAFGDPFGPTQLLGGSAILAGIAITTAPIITARTSPQRSRPQPSDQPMPETVVGAAPGPMAGRPPCTSAPRRRPATGARPARTRRPAGRHTTLRVCAPVTREVYRARHRDRDARPRTVVRPP
ncbi:MAG TPA: DMT family transporter [Pilimelia sp.]|nr:DMT family transporter [Pilimelia sp.]